MSYLTIGWMSERFGKFLDDPIIISGGRELTFKMLWESRESSKLGFSVFLNGVWIGDIGTEEQITVLYKIMTGIDLTPFDR